MSNLLLKGEREQQLSVASSVKLLLPSLGSSPRSLGPAVDFDRSTGATRTQALKQQHPGLARFGTSGAFRGILPQTTVSRTPMLSQRASGEALV